MTGKTKKTILFSVIGLVAIGAAIGYYYYNKGLINVEHASPDTKVSSTELYQAFSTDSVAANKKFARKDEIVEVSGIVSSISQNQDNKAIILLKTNEADASINCTLEGSAEKINEKDAIRIKGICTGIGTGDTTLGILGDVYLIRCYISK